MPTPTLKYTAMSLALAQAFEHGEEALARNGENSVAALDNELVDKDLAAGAYRHGDAP